MAKSARATTVKRNRAKLRSSIFGPADQARTERLSMKLQELAAQPKPARDEDTTAKNGEKGRYLLLRCHSWVCSKGFADNLPGASSPKEPSASAMDIDEAQPEDTKRSHKNKRVHASRIEKKKLRRKARSSIVFPRKPTTRGRNMRKIGK